MKPEMNPRKKLKLKPKETLKIPKRNPDERLEYQQCSEYHAKWEVMNVWSTNMQQIPYKLRGWRAKNIANTVQNDRF